MTFQRIQAKSASDINKGLWDVCVLDYEFHINFIYTCICWAVQILKAHVFLWKDIYFKKLLQRYKNKHNKFKCNAMLVQNTHTQIDTNKLLDLYNLK